MSQHRQPMTQVPVFFRIVDPLARLLLGLGIRMGPNRLITIRGRRSGLPRTAAVAVVEVEGRRWVIGSFGEVNWVRNLRAAGEGVIQARRRPQPVRAVELSTEEAAAFFLEALIPYVGRLPRWARMFTRRLVREILDDPAGAASTRPVFELHAHNG